MKSEFLNLIEVAGIITFSISGVLAAQEKKLDIFVIFIIAFITAMGGGTLLALFDRIHFYSTNACGAI